RTLRRNEIVGFVLDQSRPGEPRLKFFSHPAKTNTSLAQIWRKWPAPVVPAYIVRRSVGCHDGYFLPPLNLQKTTDPEDDIVINSTLFNRTLEKIISDHPDQYFWMHDRWK